MASIPKLFNQLRLDSFSFEYDPASLAPTGLLTANYVASSTFGPQRFGIVDVTLGPDDDPSAVLAAGKTAAAAAFVTAGYTSADDPSGYSA